MEALAVAHDAEGSHGFVMECDGHRAGFATDLGHVPAELIERFRGVDLLAMESNYDPEMEMNSDRPYSSSSGSWAGAGTCPTSRRWRRSSILDRTERKRGGTGGCHGILCCCIAAGSAIARTGEADFFRGPRIAPVLSWRINMSGRDGWGRGKGERQRGRTTGPGVCLMGGGGRPPACTVIREGTAAGWRLIPHEGQSGEHEDDHTRDHQWRYEEHGARTRIWSRRES